MFLNVLDSSGGIEASFHHFSSNFSHLLAELHSPWGSQAVLSQANKPKTTSGPNGTKKVRDGNSVHNICISYMCSIY